MKSPEELIVRIINHLAENMKESLVLEGGMLLRLYHSPRSTRDIDFILVSEESKKILKNVLLEHLQKLEDVSVGRVDLNSRGIFMDLESDGQKVLVEISVLPSLHLPAEALSTAYLSEKYSLGARIVSTMSVAEAFAHKIAAAVERDVVRDLYDLSQFEAMGQAFDTATLKSRFSRLQINRAKPRLFTCSQAADILEKRLGAIDQQKIETELYPLLPAEFHTGLLAVIRATVGRIIQRLKTMEAVSGV